MIYQAHLRTAAGIIQAYKGGQPFSIFIKDFFRADKKYGSRDRRQISHLCYCFFRLGRLGLSLPLEKRILAGFFLCSREPDDLLSALVPGLAASVALPLAEKLVLCGIEEPVENLFPFIQHISPELDPAVFSAAHLIQPDLFLRVRPGFHSSVTGKLTAASIPFLELEAECLALPNSSKIDGVIGIDREALIQDLSSQRVGALMKQPADRPIRIWDCCAASGGKSIMAVDRFSGPIQLTVSDIRENILFNLRKRFHRAGIQSYKSFVADLEDESLRSPELKASEPFDFIIADVPCSGSGTWGRTPEQLWSFQEDRIDHYASLQKKIALNSSRYLRPGGQLLYITCSVYRQENEAVCEFLQSQGLQILERHYYPGYVEKADTLFACLFRSAG